MQRSKNQTLPFVSKTTGPFGPVVRKSKEAHSAANSVLTLRQTECLRLTSVGHSSAKIASLLDISDDVVNEHISKACKRLNVRTRTQAVAVALMMKLL